MNIFIVCSKCGHPIPIAEAMAAAMETELKQQVEGERERINRELSANMEQEKRRYRQDLEYELSAKAKEEESLRQKKVLELEARLAETKGQAAKAKLEQETELLRRTRGLEEREAKMTADAERAKLESERKFREERNQMQTKVREEIEGEARLKQAEADTLIASMMRQIDELKHKVDQTSQQLQGEAQEMVLEEVLRMVFPSDIISAVPKGFKGADCLQRVRTNGEPLGSIIWESKRTKQWLNEWIAKLKDDQRTAKAEVAIIVSQTLPSGINKAGNIEGVWVTDFGSAMSIALALRAGIIEVARMRTLMSGGENKNQSIFDYVTSPEFGQGIQAIVETFIAFQQDLDAEKRAMERQWAKREKTIQRALLATDRIHGSLQGILGTNAMPDLQKALPEARTD